MIRHTNTPRLITMFQEMSELTAPECAQCRAPYSCCDELYCKIADEYARFQGITLEQTGHPTIPFLGPSGCTVPPHLRPICTLHTCDINGLGFKPGDMKWTKRYFTLRRKIEKTLAQEETQR